MGIAVMSCILLPLRMLSRRAKTWHTWFALRFLPEQCIQLEVHISWVLRFTCLCFDFICSPRSAFHMHLVLS
ncbi:hypothetical protein BDW71DRAFT_142641 [Aspergillus fruticulosus]